MTEVTGRRARKKAATRQAIADAALELFLEHGFDRVAVKDVAEAADVSMSGLFKHFPTKESLVFDEEDDVQEALVSAVRDRREGTSALEALRGLLLERAREADADPEMAAFHDLVARTPTLGDYARRRWLRHEEVLATAIHQAEPGDPVAARALARFVLDRAQSGRRAEIDAAFTLLTNGWPTPEEHAPPYHPPKEAAAAPGKAAAPPAEAAAPDNETAALQEEAPARPPGLRERKKAATRRAITAAALNLFEARGYDDVGVREIADAADTSIATLFSYFPDGKVSLVFPGDRTEHVAAVVAAVHHRPPGQSVLRALHDHLAGRAPFAPHLPPEQERALDLVRATHDQRDYALRSWSLAQEPLAEAIARDAGLPDGDLAARLLARYVLQIPDLAAAIDGDARHTLDVVTALLEHGWPARGRPRTG